MNNVIVFKRSLASQLVKLGYQVVDIQPSRKDETKTVFFFKDEEGLKHDIYELTHDGKSWQTAN